MVGVALLLLLVVAGTGSVLACGFVWVRIPISREDVGHDFSDDAPNEGFTQRFHAMRALVVREIPVHESAPVEEDVRHAHATRQLHSQRAASRD